MDSPQSVVSSFKSPSGFVDGEKQQIGNTCVENSREAKSEGALDVYIHQARDIHNICIYQKQDVYAKLCLTSDPEKAVSTKIINGGGRNPVFNEGVRLDTCKADSSLKCEIWMLSRVQNYLKDQLLGFAVVAVSEVLLNKGKLEKELSLSSSDLFHSPAGFVRLSICYVGTPPEVIPIPAPVERETDSLDSPKSTIPDEWDKIEFPDPKVVNENHQMVEEYIAMPCATLESQSSEIEAEREESLFSVGTETLRPSAKIDSPPTSVSTNGTSSASAAVNFDEGRVSAPKDSSKEDKGNGDVLDSESDASGGMSFVKPVVTVPEHKVVQQDIVDMYMKSMQQFTESLAKMKLPMDFESGPTTSENSSSDQKPPAASKNSGSRVFYGSRAFF